MTSPSERMEAAVKRLEGGDGVARRRYARSTRSIKVGAHLWPDVMELIQQHADEHQLTPSGAVHDCLRRYFNLPQIH